LAALPNIASDDADEEMGICKAIKAGSNKNAASTTYISLPGESLARLEVIAHDGRFWHLEV